MRAALLLPVLLLSLACSSKLERAKAEELLRREYPVVVPITVPETDSADKGSPGHLRLVTIKESLDKSGWFETTVTAEGNRETFSFRLKGDAPKAIKAAQKGFEMPAAEAIFVRAVRLEPAGNQARVTYEVRLDKPTAQFGIFQGMHPNAKVGQTKQRHATFERRKGRWELAGTDEAFRKVE